MASLLEKSGEPGSGAGDEIAELDAFGKGHRNRVGSDVGPGLIGVEFDRVVELDDVSLVERFGMVVFPRRFWRFGIQNCAIGKSVGKNNKKQDEDGRRGTHF